MCDISFMKAKSRAQKPIILGVRWNSSVSAPALEFWDNWMVGLQIPKLATDRNNALKKCQGDKGKQCCSVLSPG